MPPDIRRQLAERSLLGRDEPWSHVRFAIHGCRIEVVAPRILDVHENRVVLRRPAILRFGSVVVCPDDLVEKTFPAEERVEQHFRVVRLAVVEVQVEGAVVGEQAPRLGQPRFEKAPVVVEAVVVTHQVAANALVQLPLESADLRSRRRGHGCGARSQHRIGRRNIHSHIGRRLAALRPARIERGIEVDDRERAVGELGDHVEVVTPDDAVRQRGRVVIRHSPTLTCAGRSPRRKPIAESVEAQAPAFLPPRV